MTNYDYLIKRTCYLSRWKETDKILKYKDRPITFHSMCAKIFAAVLIEDPTLKDALKLDGDEMWSDIEKAVNLVIPDASNEKIEQWYRAIREHFNGGRNLKEIQNGGLILEQYMFIKGEGLNWEESFQIAKHYLEKDLITKIRNFYYDYIIFVDIEKLNVKDNRNAIEFKDAFMKWNARNTKKNIYKINVDNKIESIEIFQDTEEEFIQVFIKNEPYEEKSDPNIEFLEDILAKDDGEAI